MKMDDSPFDGTPFDTTPFDNTVVELNPPRPRRLSVGTVIPKSKKLAKLTNLTSSELVVLGALALNAADEAKQAGNESLAKRLAALACKCDQLANDD